MSVSHPCAQRLVQLPNILIVPGHPRIPINDKAREFLEKLKARDEVFVQGLLDKEPITDLERKSLKLSSDEEEHLEAAIYAWSSLEIIQLAEDMKDRAKAFPFEGQLTEAVRESIQKIIEQLRILPFRRSRTIEQAIEQIEKLLELFERPAEQ